MYLSPIKLTQLNSNSLQNLYSFFVLKLNKNKVLVPHQGLKTQMI